MGGCSSAKLRTANESEQQENDELKNAELVQHHFTFKAAEPPKPVNQQNKSKMSQQSSHYRGLETIEEQPSKEDKKDSLNINSYQIESSTLQERKPIVFSRVEELHSGFLPEEQSGGMPSTLEFMREYSVIKPSAGKPREVIIRNSQSQEKIWTQVNQSGSCMPDLLSKSHIKSKMIPA